MLLKSSADMVSFFKSLKFFKKHETYHVTIDSISAIVQRQEQNQVFRSSDEKCIKSRHIVALLGFLVFFVLNCQRFNLSIAIVAMVNTTAENKRHISLSSLNVTEYTMSSCPKNVDVTEHIISQEPKGEFDWDPVLQGYILGSGSVGYVLTHIPGGRWADTFGAKIVIVISLLLSSLCNLITPLVAWWNVYMLIAVHFIKGLAQGVLQPAASALMSNWFPLDERSYLSSIVLSGLFVGCFAGFMIFGVLCDTTFLGGWPAVFYSMGILGIVLFVIALFFLHGSPHDDPNISEAELKYITESCTNASDTHKVPWKGICTSVSSYALFIGMFGQSWIAFYFSTVHPIYMGTILNYSITMIGLLSSVPNILVCLTGLCAGWLSDWLNKKKLASVSCVRKGCRFSGTIVFCFCIGGIYIVGCDEVLHNVFLTLAVGFIGVGIPSTMILAADMTPKFSGTLMGLACAIANTSGFIVPVITGMMIEEENTLVQWRHVFLVMIAVELFAGVFFLFFGSAEIQQWDVTAEEKSTPRKHEPHQEKFQQWDATADERSTPRNQDKFQQWDATAEERSTPRNQDKFQQWDVTAEERNRPRNQEPHQEKFQQWDVTAEERSTPRNQEPHQDKFQQWDATAEERSTPRNQEPRNQDKFQKWDVTAEERSTLRNQELHQEKSVQ